MLSQGVFPLILVYEPGLRNELGRHQLKIRNLIFIFILIVANYLRKIIIFEYRFNERLCSLYYKWICFWLLFIFGLVSLRHGFTSRGQVVLVNSYNMQYRNFLILLDFFHCFYYHKWILRRNWIVLNIYVTNAMYHFFIL